MYVPSSTKNNIDIVPVKYLPINTKSSCGNDNTNNINDISCASNNGNITLSKINQQKSGIEPIPISNPQNVTVPTYQPTSTQIASDVMSNLLTEQASSTEELLDNAFSIEQLLVNNPSKTDINCSICTPPDRETLLSVMISSMKQIVTDASTSPLIEYDERPTDVVDIGKTESVVHSVCDPVNSIVATNNGNPQNFIQYMEMGMILWLLLIIYLSLRGTIENLKHFNLRIKMM